MNNALRQLEDLGQSIWLDNISRALIRSGELKRLTEEGLLGMTSNPTIFDKAISGSTDYDAQLQEVLTASPLAPTYRTVKLSPAPFFIPALSRRACQPGHVVANYMD